MRQTILNRDFSFLNESLVREHYFDDARGDNAVLELKRFLILVALNDEPMALPRGCDVDVAWHEFILHTTEYREFCDSVFGEFIDHMPRTDRNPIPREAIRNAITCYEDLFQTNMTHSWLPASYKGKPRQDSLNLIINAEKWSGWPGRGEKRFKG